MTQTLSLGPLSLLAEQHGPFLTITIHARCDSAPVGKMTLTVPEWTALVAMVDSLAVADREMARLRQERAQICTSMCSSNECQIRRQCAKVECTSLYAQLDYEAWTTAMWYLGELRQQVRELTKERDKARRDVAANRALSMLAPKEMSYDDRSEFDRLKHSDVAQGKRIADLIAEHDRLRSDLSAALVSVDAMGERLKVVGPVYEAAVRWRNTLASDPPTKHEAYCGLCNAIDTALAHTAREQAKESK